MIIRRKTSAITHVVVFLGNPGREYERTRHNAGFMTAGVLEQKLGVKIKKLKFNSLFGICEIGKYRAALIKPQTYMNRSGIAVRDCILFYKVPVSGLIVVSDEVALPIGKVRIRTGGSAGGHNGLKDIIEKCGDDKFVRLRIGVGAPPHKDYSMADWVLSVMTDDDLTQLKTSAERSADAIIEIITNGTERAMSVYN